MRTRALRVGLVVLAALVSLACAPLLGRWPVPPRFVAVFEQDEAGCRLQLLRDERSPLCLVWVRCGGSSVLAAVPSEACVP